MVYIHRLVGLASPHDMSIRNVLLLDHLKFRRIDAILDPFGRYAGPCSLDIRHEHSTGSCLPTIFVSQIRYSSVGLQALFSVKSIQFCIIQSCYNQIPSSRDRAEVPKVRILQIAPTNTCTLCCRVSHCGLNFITVLLEDLSQQSRISVIPRNLTDFLPQRGPCRLLLDRDLLRS